MKFDELSVMNSAARKRIKMLHIEMLPMKREISPQKNKRPATNRRTPGSPPPELPYHRG
jgi:hypothetical protein